MDPQDAIRLLVGMIEKGSAPASESLPEEDDSDLLSFGTDGKGADEDGLDRDGGDTGDWEGVDSSTLARQVVRGTAELNKKKLATRGITFRMGESEHATLKRLALAEDHSIQMLIHEGVRLLFLSRRLRLVLDKLDARTCEGAVRTLILNTLTATQLPPAKAPKTLRKDRSQS